MREVSEDLTGMVGPATVAVFRDAEGVDFCPDAPTVPANHVSSLVSVSSVAALPAAEAPVAVTANVHFYRSAAAALSRRKGEDAGSQVGTAASPAASAALQTTKQ